MAGVVTVVSASFLLAALAMAAAFVTDGGPIREALCTIDWTRFTEFDRAETADFVERPFADRSMSFTSDYCSRVIVRLGALALVGGVAGLAGAAYLLRAGGRVMDGLPAGLKGDARILAVMMVIALLTRWPALQVGLWRDEASSYFNSISADGTRFWETLIFSELNPPAYYLLLHEWMSAFGTSDVVIKMPSLLFGLLLIPVTYALGRAAGSSFAGLLAAAFVTVSHEVIYYSQEARPYTMSAVLATLTTISAIQSFRRPGRYGPLVVLALSGSALVYTHYSGLIFLGVLFLGTVFLAWRRAIDGSLWTHVAAYGAIFLLYLPWLPIFFQHLQTGTPWTIKTPLMELPRLFANNLSYGIPWDGEVPARILMVLLFLAALAASALRFLRWERSDRRHQGSDAIPVFLGFSFFAAAAIFTVMSYSGRYLFPFLGLFYVFLSVWIVRLARVLPLDAPRPIALLLGLGWIAITGWHQATRDVWDKSGTRALAAAILPEEADNTLYVVSPDLLSPTLGYYLRDRDVPFVGFARHDDSEIFSPVGYAALWADPEAIENLMSAIEVRRETTDSIVLIQSACGAPLQDEGQVPFSRANDVSARLTETFPITAQRYYPGFLECVRTTRLCLRDCENTDHAETTEAD